MTSAILSVASGAISPSGLVALVVTTILCWGAWGIFDKKALESGSPKDVFLILLLCELPQIPIAAAILFGQGLAWEPSWPLIVWPALSALTMSISTLVYLMALKEAEASYVLGITASYPLLVQFFAVYLVDEPLGVPRLVGALLIAAGVFAVGFSAARHGSGKGTAAGNRTWFIIGAAVVSTVCWALYGLFDKKAVMVANPWFVYFWQSVFNGILILPFAALLRWRGHQPKLNNGRVWLFCSLSALSLSAGAICCLLAMSVAEASYVIAISGCYPLVMYVLAVLMLKERVNWVRVLGIGLIVGGGIVVQLTHSL